MVRFMFRHSWEYPSSLHYSSSTKIGSNSYPDEFFPQLDPPPNISSVTSDLKNRTF